MSDNVTANAGTGGATFATDDDGTAHHPYVKIEFGADNTFTKVSSSNPLPVDASGQTLTVGSHAVTNAGTFAVQSAQSGAYNITNISGTVSLPTGAATAAKQPALGTAGTASSDVLTIQGVASMTKLLVTPDANAAVNVAQMNGVTVTMGNGAAGTGVQRVAVSSDNTPFQVAGSNETGSIYSGTTALTPKFATISTSTSGASQVVAAVSSKKLRVVSLSMMANAAVNAKFQSHVTPTDKTGLYYMAANGGFVLPYNPVGWFETISGEALDINLSAANAVGGCLTYVEV